MSPTLLPVRVLAAETVTEDVRALTLGALGDAPLPAFSPGSHVVVHVPGEARPRRNAYSLACSPWGGGPYRIVVRRLPGGRGSVGIHEHVAVGQELTLELPQNFFAPDATARRHVLVAGGIGITPFVSYAHALHRTGTPYELHFAFRTTAGAPLLGELAGLCGDALHAYADPDGTVLLTTLREDVLPAQPLGTHLSVCGPPPMIDAVLAAARALGWPESRLHLERFAVDSGPMEPFTVDLASGGSVTVPEGVTLLEALEEAGHDVPSLCRLGFCGECRTGVLGGRPDHRDCYLAPEEHEAGTAMMPCVSRCAEGPLVLDL